LVSGSRNPLFEKFRDLSTQFLQNFCGLSSIAAVRRPNGKRRRNRQNGLLLAAPICYKTSDIMAESPRKNNKAVEAPSQSDRAVVLLRRNGMMRTRELVGQGVAATTITRMEREGTIHRLSRGLYQLPDAPLDIHHDLAEAAKRVPKGVICLTSALAFHGLTDQIPRRVWMAIGSKDWEPGAHGPKLELVRLTAGQLTEDVELHEIESVPVRIFNIPRTLVDSFRFRKTVGLSVAVEALREALRQRRITPSEIASRAQRNGSWRVMRPYLEALTIDG
jgi:predicted transcriptional regulator of viral defense system